MKQDAATFISIAPHNFSATEAEENFKWTKFCVKPFTRSPSEPTPSLQNFVWTSLYTYRRQKKCPFLCVTPINR